MCYYCKIGAHCWNGITDIVQRTAFKQMNFCLKSVLQYTTVCVKTQCSVLQFKAILVKPLRANIWHSLLHLSAVTLRLHGRKKPHSSRDTIFLSLLCHAGTVMMMLIGL